MTETVNETTAVILFTGAGTARQRKRSPTFRAGMSLVSFFEYLDARKTNQLYGKLVTMMAASSTIVPEGYGLNLPLLSYKRTEPVIDHKLEKHSDAQLEFFGHSLGGVIAALYAHRHPEKQIHTTAVSSPFGEVHGLPVVGSFFKHITEEIATIREELNDEAPELTLIGSENDRLIPASSSLPDLPGAQRIIFTRDPQSAINRGLLPVYAEDPPGHMRILDHPQALDLYENGYRPSDR